MTEEFLQYIWKHKLFKQKTYIASTGEPVEIVHQGTQNTNSGPDFSNVRIRIANTLWAGNCEVHILASDWNKHTHTADPAYMNIILHVVRKNDIEVKGATGILIPCIELDYDEGLECNYKELLKSELWIPCANVVGQIQPIQLIQWQTSLSVERLEKHSTEIISLLMQSQNHWEEAFYISLAKSFGFGVNGLPFQMLAKSLPLNILAKHKDSLFQLEALLFGQSGLITKPEDNYSEMLLKEYSFLQKKYGLKPIEGYLFKFMRLRPMNFPTVRIAQFAALIFNSSALFSKIIAASNLQAMYNLFNVKASEYWDTHYKFGKASIEIPKQLTTASINILLINAVIPFIFVHGKQIDNSAQQDKAITFLEELPSENNSIIRNWAQLGIKVSNAFESQALLELKNEYCNNRKCLHCNIGMHVIAKKVS